MVQLALSLIALIGSVAFTSALSSEGHAGSLLRRSHPHISHRRALEVKRASKKRCRPRKPSNSNVTKPDPPKDDGGKDNGNDNQDSGNQDNGPTSGVINVNDGRCGGAQPKDHTTNDNGPNGRQAWMMCGVDDDGWNPPDVSMDDIVHVSLSDALKDDNSPFKACNDFLDTFNTMASKHGIPAIFAASFAMQESSCNPDTVGGNGEQGLMQITRDKCEGRSDEDCREVSFNIEAGVKYFANELKNNGGNPFVTVGAYNGYFKKMTVGDATAAASFWCSAQNNLDYLQQFFNGWIMNVDPYTQHLGTYHNLDNC